MPWTDWCEKHYGLKVNSITHKQQPQQQLKCPFKSQTLKQRLNSTERVVVFTEWPNDGPLTFLSVCVCEWVRHSGWWEVRQFSWPASEKKLSDTQQTNRQQQLLSENTTLSEDTFRHAKYMRFNSCGSLITWSLNYEMGQFSYMQKTNKFSVGMYSLNWFWFDLSRFSGIYLCYFLYVFFSICLNFL